MKDKKKELIEAERFYSPPEDIGEPLPKEEAEALLKKARKRDPDLFPE